MKKLVVTVFVLGVIGLQGTTAYMIYWLGTELNATRAELAAVREASEAKDAEIE